ncbi:MAG: NADH-quinone oxidoreductase subunit N [Nitrospira sp.]|nr:NADH-quinone oxidoreductase subunit N [Nitrospira sp.]
MTFSSGDLLLVLPELLVVLAACTVLAVEPLLAPPQRDGLAWLSLGTLAVCMGLIASRIGHRAEAFGGLVTIDDYGSFWKLLLCFVAGLTVLLSYSYLKEERLHIGEYYAFVLLALSGMMVMVSATDLLTIYLGTELMSLSLYVMAGLKRSEPRSLEASAKYFVLGAFSSGIMLYGVSLLYGATGSTRLTVIGSAIANTGSDAPLPLVATVLLAAGFGFKLALVPFHMWTPDVYQGAPTSVTAFMAVASKAASFGAFLRVFLEGLGGLKTDWSVLLLVLCVATLVLGNSVALVQTNIKRMLAYSSIAHAGYAMIGVVAAGWAAEGGRDAASVASVLLYIAVYVFMTFGAFAVVAMLRKGDVEGEEIEDFTGLAKRHPLGAFMMLVFMVSLAGIPPTAGFIGKFYVFMSAVEAGLAWLAVIALIFAVVSAYYYLRVVLVMYMREPTEGTETSPRLVLSPTLSIVLACAIAGVVMLGLYPSPLVSLATQAVRALQ